MTLDQAKDAARSEAMRLNRSFMVWRMPAWPVDCWAIIEQRELPPEAQIAETVGVPTTGMLF